MEDKNVDEGPLELKVQRNHLVIQKISKKDAEGLQQEDMEGG